MKSTIDFVNIESGLKVVLQNEEHFISWGSSFNDLYPIANESRIVNNFNPLENKIVRSDSFYFNNQIIIEGIRNTQIIATALRSTNDLGEQGISSFTFNLNVYDDQAIQLYKDLEVYFDNLLGKGQREYSELKGNNIYTYTLNSNIKLQIDCDDWWSKGTRYKLDMVIKNTTHNNT